MPKYGLGRPLKVVEPSIGDTSSDHEPENEPPKRD